MSITFYPHVDDAGNGTLHDRIEVLSEAAARYKAAVLDMDGGKVGRHVELPKDIALSFNWDAIAAALREIREKPEGTKDDRLAKANYLEKLAEVYEALRGARMSKLEAVRLALMTESNQLRGGLGTSANVA